MQSLNLFRESLEEPSVLQKLRGTPPKRNAFRELKNQLIDAEKLTDVDEDFVYSLEEKYGVDLQREFFHDLRKLYVKFITFFLLDEHASEEEIADVWHLKKIFGISGAEHERLFKKAAKATYQRSLISVLSDGEISDAERKHLDDLSVYLDLSQKAKDELLKSSAKNLVEYKLRRATADNRVSDRELAEIEQIQSNLGVNINYDGSTGDKLAFCRLIWQIENAELPEVDAGINLNKGEKCVLKTQADWSEHRTVTRRVRYSGPTLRIRIMKGVYWRAGDLAVSTKSEEILRYIDTAEVFITTKRIILQGETKSTSICLNKILDVTPHADGITVQKDAGRSPFLRLLNALDTSQEVEIFCATLCRVIRDYG